MTNTTLYLNNYKSFEKFFLDIANVNFLVGENSTGKTALLKIINVIQSSDFGHEYSFNNNQVELGYFNEIMNLACDEKNFQIGFERSIEGVNYRFLFNFEGDGVNPSLKTLHYCNETYDMSLTINNGNLNINGKERDKSSFKEWVEVAKDISKEASLASPEFHGLPPLRILLLICEMEVQNELNKDKTESVKLDTNYPMRNERLFDNYSWLAHIRAKPKRIYENYKNDYSPEGAHTPSLLKDMLAKDKGNKLSILKSFGNDSKLFDSVQINQFGKDKFSPFEVVVKYADNKLKLTNVGHGVSQSLPIVVDILSQKNTVFSIQQPEVHLHPKAQAAFGSFLFKSSTKDKNQFLIETHSDFLINRFRYCLAKVKNEDIEIPSSQVIFFERNDGKSRITAIKISDKGQYDDNLPSTFTDFFIDEEFKMLEI